MIQPDQIPDVRDGLTRLERIILYQLRQLEQERPGRSIPSIQLYGRVAEHYACTPEEMQSALSRLTGLD